MKKNKAHDARGYQFASGEGVLVDTNVWLYMHPALSKPAPTWAAIYGSIFSRLLNAGALPFTNALVLSEYCNAYLRLEYHASSRGARPGTFKAFRNSAVVQPILEDLVSKMQDITDNCRFGNISLSSADMSWILRAVKSGIMDFNDGILLATCQRRNLKLLTHDGDMTVGGVEVLTTNRGLLRACP